LNGELFMMRKTLHTAAAAALVVVAAAGCSSDSNNGGTVNCSGSVSGAINGSYSCTAVTAVWATTNNIGGLTINATGTPTITIGIGFTGAPTTKTYSSSDADAISGVTVTSGTAVWLASVSGGTAQGSYQLHLTSVGTAVTSANGNSYAVHGTLTATLPAASGTTASGTVTASFTF
jgi:hypothetical protein